MTKHFRANLAKGIFCLETDWAQSLDHGSKTLPMLELLHAWGDWHVPYIHRDVATREAFEYYLSKWVLRQAERYPILYLALHGDAGSLTFGDWRRSANSVSLEALGDLLEGRCHGRIIHFGTCEFLALPSRSIRAFMRKTGALAVSGYTEEVDWMEATLADATIFAAMQHNALTIPGATAMRRAILDGLGTIAKRLGFRMFVAS